MQIELKRIQREVGITFIFVTHDQGEALTMSDRIAVMSRGRVEQIGTPEEIYERPASIFVAGFIGSANLLPGTLEGAGSGTPIAVLDSGVRLALPSAGDARDGDPITVMLRPERVTLGAADRTSDGRSLPATVKDVIFQGSSLRLIADAPGDTELLVTVEMDDDTPDLRAGRRRSRCTGRPVRRTCCAAARRSSARRRPTSTRCRRRWTARTSPRRKADDARDAAGVAGSAAGRVLIGGGVVAAGRGRRRAAVGRRRRRRRRRRVPEDGEGTAGGGIGQGATELDFINWTEYIDPTEDGEPAPSTASRTRPGISVNYSETFNDNNEVYGKEFAAYLDAGNPTPWDIAAPDVLDGGPAQGATGGWPRCRST